LTDDAMINVVPAPTGQEQKVPVIVSLVVLIAVVVYGVLNADEDTATTGWYWVTGVQTFFAFTLPILYPGFACFACARSSEQNPGLFSAEL
jgi:hypothetical protein